MVRLVKEKPLGTVGGVIVLILVLTAVFAFVLAPYPYQQLDLAARLAPPSAAHILGTDNLGRDMLSRIIYGARISLFVGLVGSLLAICVAITLGVTSGYLGGKFDIIMQRFVDAFMCMPPLFVYLTVMAIIGPGLIQVTLVLGIDRGIIAIRTVRSAVISIKNNMYIEAARVIGVSTNRMFFRHILPNVMAPIIIIFSVQVGSMILMESTLSFLGFGIPPPMPSWGGMISGIGRDLMTTHPWLVFWPGAALSIVVYGVNMFGDGVRDLLDPRLRGGLGRFGGVKVSGSVVASQAKK